TSAIGRDGSRGIPTTDPHGPSSGDSSRGVPGRPGHVPPRPATDREGPRELVIGPWRVGPPPSDLAPPGADGSPGPGPDAPVPRPAPPAVLWAAPWPRGTTGGRPFPRRAIGWGRRPRDLEWGRPAERAAPCTVARSHSRRPPPRIVPGRPGPTGGPPSAAG